MIAAHLGLEIEGPDHAQSEDGIDDSRHGYVTDVETAACGYLGLEQEGPDQAQVEDDNDDSKQ